MSTKVCSKCKVEKARSEFHRHKGKRDGLQAYCKACQQSLYISNFHEVQTRERERYTANREAELARRKLYHATNREKVLTRQRLFREANRDRILAQSKASYQRFKEIHGTDPVTLRSRRNHQARLAGVLRKRLQKALRRNQKTGSAVQDLGMPIDAFLTYLNLDALDKYCIPYTGNESKFHIDHIRPLASFNLEDPEQLRIAVRWDNLQVLRAEENLRKGARYVQAH